MFSVENWGSSIPEGVSSTVDAKAQDTWKNTEAVDPNPDTNMLFLYT